ncbi:MAG TPA: hypothetical protein VND20_07690 [Candidatus Binataceae bacterium]|nr:hypothetical protein [Candidatus Binataceae bacterium]
MLIAAGSYRYEIRRAGAAIAIEEDNCTADAISGVRRAATGDNRHEVDAALDTAGVVARVTVRYHRGMFARTATYEADGEALRGRVSAVAGHNEVVVKLGRFREIDADLILFRALLIAHIRARGQTQWTGRIAMIDPNTLVAAALKQSVRQSDEQGLRWVYEARMGDTEEIELDADGRITRVRDGWGVEKILSGFAATPAG